jgi:hypothetical protein
MIGFIVQHKTVVTSSILEQLQNLQIMSSAFYPGEAFIAVL